MLAGCATTLRGTTQRVSVVTDPPGASCSLVNGPGAAIVIIAPGEAEVQRSRAPLDMRCVREGYLEAAERFDSALGAQGDTDEQRRRMTTAGVVGGAAYVGLSAITVTTMAPTLGGGAAIAGAGIVAAPVLALMVIGMPVAGAIDLATGAAFGYPPQVTLTLVPAEFPDEGARSAYFDAIDRRLDQAREALRIDTAATCAKWNCGYLRDQDDAFIAAQRAKFAALRASTRIIAAPP